MNGLIKQITFIINPPLDPFKFSPIKS